MDILFHFASLSPALLSTRVPSDPISSSLSCSCISLVRFISLVCQRQMLMEMETSEALARVTAAAAAAAGGGAGARMQTRKNG